MRAEDRLDYIMTTASNNGFVSIAETAQLLGVSNETIRRDINVLCGENKLRKVWGGASPVKLMLRRELNYSSRKSKNLPEKMAIGREAAQMITDGKVVFFDCGVSIQMIASAVTDVKNVTFITNSIPTMSILLDKFSKGEIDGRVIMIGGEINTENRFATGAAAVEHLDRFCADLAFISCTAISARAVSTYDIDESYFSAHIMDCASMSVLVAESEKMGKNSVYSFAKITDFSRIITDSENRVPEDIIEIIENSDTDLTIVEKQPSDEI